MLKRKKGSNTSPALNKDLYVVAERYASRALGDNAERLAKALAKYKENPELNYDEFNAVVLSILSEIIMEYEGVGALKLDNETSRYVSTQRQRSTK